MFRGGVSMVRVDAQVVDGKRAIADLDKSDFTIVDEREPAVIEYFGREAEPLWLVLLLDVSGSMTKYVADMARVSRDALGRLRPEDRVSVVLFGRKTRVELDFTDSRPDATAAIGRAARDKALAAGSAINSAIIDAATHLKTKAEGTPGRRAIVILTDNADLNYQVPDEAAISALYGADAVLNAIVTPKAKPPTVAAGRNPDFTPANVFALAKESGGEVLRAEKADETFREMIERIRTRYSLHYRPPEGKPGGMRHIRVELSKQARARYPKAEVRARTGYSQ